MVAIAPLFTSRGARDRVGRDPGAYRILEYKHIFRPCFFSEAKKAKERFKVVVVGGGSDR